MIPVGQSFCIATVFDTGLGAWGSVVGFDWWGIVFSIFKDDAGENGHVAEVIGAALY